MESWCGERMSRWWCCGDGPGARCDREDDGAVREEGEAEGEQLTIEQRGLRLITPRGCPASDGGRCIAIRTIAARACFDRTAASSAFRPPHRTCHRER